MFKPWCEWSIRDPKSASKSQFLPDFSPPKKVAKQIVTDQ